MKATSGILAAALLFVTGAACSSGSADAPVASTSRPSSSPTVAASPTAPTDPLEGTWETRPLSPEDIVSAFEAAGGSEREGKAFSAQLGKGAVITIKLLAGSWVMFETGDGGVTINGDERTYELLGDGSLRLTATDCVGTYTYREPGDRLTLQVVKQCSRRDAPYATTLYASFPFTRVS